MSEWKNKSDFEVNKVVAGILDFGDLVQFNSDEKETVYICEKDGLDSVYPVCEFNPCNNPPHSWSIMMESGISTLTENGNLFGATTDSYEYFEPHGNKIFSCEDKNPLRAAMIVYLEMNGVRP